MVATKKKKETTLDDLVRAMSCGFKESDQKLENLARMMANGFADMDKRFENVDKKFSVTDGKIRTLFDENRLIRADLQDIKNILKPLVQMAGVHDIRLDRLEKFVGTGK